MSAYASPALARGGRSGRLWLMLAVLLAAAALGLTAVLSPIAAVALVVGVAFVVAAFKDLAASVALFTFLIFFERFPGVGDSQLTLIKVAGGVLVASWLLTLAQRSAQTPRLLRDHPVLTYAVVALVAWTFFSALWAQDVGEAASTAFRLLQGAVLIFVLYAALREPKHLRWTAWAYVLGASLTALVGLAGASSPEIVDPTEDVNRLTGQIGDPNELAAILIPALWLAGFLLVTTRGAWKRVLLGGCVLLVVVALFYTESRGGLVGLGVSVVVALFLAGRVRAWVISMILVTAAAGFVYYTLVATPESLTRLTEFSAGGGTGRTDLWSIALQIWRDHPVVGIGSGNFPLVEPSYAIVNTNLIRPDLVVDFHKVVHNTYLNVLVELGLVGLVALLAAIGGVAVLAWRAVRDFARAGDDDMEMLARGFLIGFAGMLVAFGFISAVNEKQLWLFLGLGVAFAGVAAREAKAWVALEPPQRRLGTIDRPRAPTTG